MRSLILGHRGMVGSALLRAIPDAKLVPFDENLDLRKRKHAEGAVEGHAGPYDVVYLCAAKVGGIQRNINERGTMIYDNLMIQANVIEAARKAGVKLFVFLGSSCIYPAPYFLRDGNREWQEDDLMAGQLEPTNEPYAVAKIAGIKMLEAYRQQYGMEFLAVMPCNLYGPGDNYDPENSHFIPGMIRRFHEAKVSHAKSVTLWGTGTPRREVMHVGDCARIITELVEKNARGIVNIGPGKDYPISTFSTAVAATVGYAGSVDWDTSKPDGTASKLMNVSRMLSYKTFPKIPILPEGLDSAYRDFLKRFA